MSGQEQPNRMCIVCRRRFAKKQLLRHVFSPALNGSGEALVKDEAQKMPGRGWYVCADEKCRGKFPDLAGARHKRKGV